MATRRTTSSSSPRSRPAVWTGVPSRVGAVTRAAPPPKSIDSGRSRAAGIAPSAEREPGPREERRVVDDLASLDVAVEELVRERAIAGHVGEHRRAGPASVYGRATAPSRGAARLARTPATSRACNRRASPCGWSARAATDRGRGRWPRPSRSRRWTCCRRSSESLHAASSTNWAQPAHLLGAAILARGLRMTVSSMSPDVAASRRCPRDRPAGA